MLRRLFKKTIEYYSFSEIERRRIRKIPRYTEGTTSLLGKEIFFADSISFLHGVKEIFDDECYYFNSLKPSPFIIDCGANIGLSILYFKKKYPDSQVLGFEADPLIFKILEKNLQAFECQKVEVINKAIWISNSNVNFRSEGGFSGRIPIRFDDHNGYVEATKLSRFITGDVDLLKLDIEGAEIEVIYEIEEKLKFVKKIFIEYHSPVGEQQRLHELLKILGKNNFRYYIKEAYVPKNPFKVITNLDGMDLQLNIYGIKK